MGVEGIPDANRMFPMAGTGRKYTTGTVLRPVFRDFSGLFRPPRKGSWEGNSQWFWGAMLGIVGGRAVTVCVQTGPDVGTTDPNTRSDDPMGL